MFKTISGGERHMNMSTLIHVIHDYGVHYINVFISEFGCNGYQDLQSL